MRQEAIDLYNQLTAEWNKKPQNFDKCLNLLTKLKLILAEMNFIPATGANINPKELHLARKFYVIINFCNKTIIDATVNL